MKVVLNVRGDSTAGLDVLVEQLLRDGVVYVGVVGVDCARIEDIIDELVVGDGSQDRFLLTASHPGASVAEAIEFARSLSDGFAGDDVQVVEI